ASNLARDKLFLDLLSKYVSFHVSDVVPKGAVPGPVKILSDSLWTPVIGNPAMPFAAARQASEDVRGRVIAAGHDGLLAYGYPGNMSGDAGKNNVFVQVALTWLQGDRGPSVLMDTGAKITFM